MRHVPIQVFRVALGMLGFLFAFSLARYGVRLRRAQQPLTKALTWFLRTAVTVTAILWTRGPDAVGVVLMSLIALSFAGGIYTELHPRKPTPEVHLFPRE
ncbi:MAG: hypothetical protein ABSD27_05360 [Bryobacteraceae bacterium]|jgi:hypothetical protein